MRPSQAAQQRELSVWAEVPELKVQPALAELCWAAFPSAKEAEASPRKDAVPAVESGVG
jgi:hypothetical protein